MNNHCTVLIGWEEDGARGVHRVVVEPGHELRVYASGVYHIRPIEQPASPEGDPNTQHSHVDIHTDTLPHAGRG